MLAYLDISRGPASGKDQAGAARQRVERAAGGDVGAQPVTGGASICAAETRVRATSAARAALSALTSARLPTTRVRSPVNFTRRVTVREALAGSVPMRQLARPFDTERRERAFAFARDMRIFAARSSPAPLARPAADYARDARLFARARSLRARRSSAGSWASEAPAGSASATITFLAATWPRLRTVIR